MAQQQEQQKKLFIWKEASENMLLRLVIVEETYQFKQGSRQRGAIRLKIAEDLQKAGFKVTQRSVRETFDKMLKEHKKREAEEAKLSGAERDYGEIYQAITDIVERIAEFEVDRENEEKKLEKEKRDAEDMRKKAAEKLGETKKRKASSGSSSLYDSVEEDSKKEKRSAGRSGILDVLKEST
ncbi:uncharacterized protein LOC110250297 [Exaiptasia diaphana]|uniref:Uncharacterized protein n=1 Tax=Exaiptasia diaphana TaxID=2652724 RepID=A0A913XZ77_EXADI|nr:uncharacterized protein LOC110250297 [Exaiptasia diaphana]